MKLYIIPLVLVLAGCGTTASTQNPSDTDFVMVSQGSASLVYKALVGGVDYCKVTKHGIQHKDFTGSIQFKDGECSVVVEAGSDVSN